MALTKATFSLIDGTPINVLDFGAVPDYYLPNGSVNPSATDNAAAFQAAIDYAITNSGLTGILVYVPQGAYGISQSITIANTRNFHFQGAGKYASAILPLTGFLGADDCLLEVGSGTNDVRRTIVSDIGILANATAGQDKHGIRVSSFFNVEIRDVIATSGEIITRETAGLYLEDCLHVKVSACNFHNGFGYGMMIGTAGEVQITECVFEETPASIVNLALSGPIMISNCYFGTLTPRVIPVSPNSNEKHIDFSRNRSVGLEISNCYIAGCNFGVDTAQVDNLVINGNIFTNCTRYGISRRDDSFYAVISNNIFDDCGTDASSTDATTGTTDPDTSPFCCDIYLGSNLFENPVSVTGNVSNTAGDSTAFGRPMVLAFGNQTRNRLCLIANSTSTQNVAYVNAITGNDYYVTVYQAYVSGQLIGAANGTTANRPAVTLFTGQFYFDTTIGKPIWWNGTGWVDSAGSPA